MGTSVRSPYLPSGGQTSSIDGLVQGKPAARWGRKARDLRFSVDRPVAGPEVRLTLVRYRIVKANLARFTMALTLLASMALSLGAGIKWY